MLPSHLENSPLTEAVAEFRFSPAMHPDLVFGALARELDLQKLRVDPLPLNQVPPALREADPNLSGQALFRISDGNWGYQIGPRVVSLHSTEYPGWGAFRDRVILVADALGAANVVDSLQRTGLRYVNFMGSSDFRLLEASLRLGSTNITDETLAIHVELPRDAGTIILKLSNGAVRQVAGRQTKGAMVDIDCITTYDGGAELGSVDVSRDFDEAHGTCKEQFFSLLTAELLQKFQPTEKESGV